MLMPPSLVLANELNEKIEQQTESTKKEKTETEKTGSEKDFDALGEFRIWRRRGSNWLKRRLEREEYAKQKKVSNSMEETDMILSNKYERQKINIFDIVNTNSKNQ